MNARPHANTGLRTFKTRTCPKQPSLGHGEVPHNQLKREVEAGIAFFWAGRAHVHRPSDGPLGFLDFRRQRA